MMKKILLTLLPVILVSCTVEWENRESAQPMMIVEGWIESGKPATVILTRIMPVAVESGNEEIFELESLPLRWATVKLTDGENEEVLVGRYDENYVPPYIYAGSDILGEPGKTYTLTVKYPNAEVRAESTMPEEVRINSAEVYANPENEREYGIKLFFDDDPDSKDYYKVFTRIQGKDTRYYPSFMGNVDDAVFEDGKGNVIVNRAFSHIQGGIIDYSTYFDIQDKVRVKLARLPEEGYDFWYEYENEITNASNVLFPSTSNIKTNIHGGKGIWCAYAVDIVDVVIP